MKVFKSFRNVKLLWYWLEKTVTFFIMINLNSFGGNWSVSLTRNHRKVWGYYGSFRSWWTFPQNWFSLAGWDKTVEKPQLFRYKYQNNLGLVSSFRLHFIWFFIFYELIVLKPWNQLAYGHWINVFKSFRNVKLLWHWLEKPMKISKIFKFWYFWRKLKNQSPEEPQRSWRVN